MGFTNLVRRFLGIEKWGSSYFYEFENSSASDFKLLEAFEQIPELNAVINWKASAFRNANIVLANENGDIIDPNPTLFGKPNYFQGQGEFLRQTKLWHEIFGNEYLYFMDAFTGKNPEKIKGLHTLPPNLIDVELSENVAYWSIPDAPEITYIIEWNGKEIELDKDKLIHLNDNRVNYSSGNIDADSFLTGTSKIVALKDPLNNIAAAYEARGINLRERGPKGILSNISKDGIGSMPMRPEDKKEVHDDFKKYGTLKGQRRVILTNASLSWQKMGGDINELMAFEEVHEDFRVICDAFGLSDDLFSREKGTTFENKKQAEKSAYQNTIIPEMDEWLDAINNHFDMPDGRKFAAKWDHLPAFQADKRQSATAMNQAVAALDKAFDSGAITIEQYQEQLSKYML